MNFMVCNFGDLGSILSRSNNVKPEKKYGDFRRNDLHLHRSNARTIIARIKPKQAFQFLPIALEVIFLHSVIRFDLKSIV